jgi:hypothetical protein
LHHGWLKTTMLAQDNHRFWIEPLLWHARCQPCSVKTNELRGTVRASIFGIAVALHEDVFVFTYICSLYTFLCKAFVLVSRLTG